MCFSKLKLNGAEYAQLLDLARIFEQSATGYNENKKSATSNFKQLSENITKKYEALKKRRDQLKTDMNTQKNFTLSRVDALVEECLR